MTIVTPQGRGGIIFNNLGAHAYMTCYHVGMKEQASIQYTIRGVPCEVDRALRRKAKLRKQSLNRLILDQLSEATTGAQRHEDFSDLVGQWVADAAFDRVIAAQRQVDWEKWK
jgi:hypothetical protein